MGDNEFKSVGKAESMPGTNGGFTMGVFKGNEIPVGTELFVKAGTARLYWGTLDNRDG